MEIFKVIFSGITLFEWVKIILMLPYNLLLVLYMSIFDRETLTDIGMEVVKEYEESKKEVE